MDRSITVHGGGVVTVVARRSIARGTGDSSAGCGRVEERDETRALSSDTGIRLLHT